MLFGPEFRWVLKGHTPDTMPMARLAEYMQEVGKLLGFQDSVFCRRIEAGSLVLVARTADPSSGGKVAARVEAVRAGAGNADAIKAFDAINRMLCEDAATASIQRGTATILRFPGKAVLPYRALTVTDTGSVTGYLYMLSHGKDGFSARLRVDDGAIICGVQKRAISALKECLFETVRVSGLGRWRQDDAGAWRIQTMSIESVKLLKTSGLRTAIEDLRAIEVDWPEDPLGYLADLNEGGGALQ